MKWTDAMRLLDECEQGLRKLVAESANEGDYVGVHRIAGLAKGIAALAKEGRAMILTDERSDSAAQTARAINGTAPPFATTAGRKPRAVADAYPKFFRRGDELVKVGWSKKERKEYNHRAPRSAVDAVALALKQVGAKGKLFNGDALLPLKNLADSGVVPDYQAYVALAFLRFIGVVEQHGRRGGYTLGADKPIESTITAAWPELAEWRG